MPGTLTIRGKMAMMAAQVMTNAMGKELAQRIQSVQEMPGQQKIPAINMMNQRHLDDAHGEVRKEIMPTKSTIVRAIENAQMDFVEDDFMNSIVNLLPLKFHANLYLFSKQNT